MRTVRNSERVELRNNSNGTATVRGYGAVFYRADNPGTEFEMGGGSHVERIMPGAFDGVDWSDVRSMFNHDSNYLLGRTRAGTARVGVDDRGVWYEADLDRENPAHRQVISHLDRGDVDGSSFWFMMDRKGTKTRKEGKRVVSEVHRISRVLELGPVVFPAYAASSADVQMRMMAEASNSLELDPRWNQANAIIRETFSQL